MRVQKLVFLSGVMLISLMGCSRNSSSSTENAPAMATTKESTMIDEGTTSEKVKMFGTEKLVYVNENDGMEIYDDKDGGKYYYKNDILVMYVSGKDADINSKITEDEVKKEAAKVVEKVSEVYNDANISVEAKKDDFGGYAVNYINKDIQLAALNYDSAGDLISANFNSEAYKSSDNTRDNYTKEEIIDAAHKEIKRNIAEEEYNTFMDEKVNTTYKTTTIQGKQYAVVEAMKDGENGKAGYLVYVSMKDLSIHSFTYDEYK